MPFARFPLSANFPEKNLVILILKEFLQEAKLPKTPMQISVSSELNLLPNFLIRIELLC
ncbi:hypothetical protein LEP1GSC050_0704 [Leptospira broomii serovar Hurstbridge str. 5399]|uniref:Uncharacterized protein n=1 Tax=Leptospira broomii serovar Hurstbridge str. 5399 TaxID=1049789 RepID=T0FFQ4_9LEPT|nr:hypothetical protein LEP1GSC050_0704 [Leptospira broomii serovar Hurstbridge str. 5399]